MKRLMQELAVLLGVPEKETLVFLALSAAGWGYFAYMHLFDAGLGMALPRYAGF